MSDARVEAAARVIPNCIYGNTVPWEEIEERSKEWWRSIATAALAAADAVPVERVVTDEMVEAAKTAYLALPYFNYDQAMRAALTAALGGHS